MYLTSTQSSLPHRYRCRTAFFHVAVIAHVTELAVIGPMPTHWSLDGEFVLEHQIPLLDNAGEALDLFRHAGADHDLPVHGYTILKNSIIRQGSMLANRRGGRGAQDSIRRDEFVG